MRFPRLLPLVAIAAGGVLAINAVENGPGIVGAARGFAEGVTRKDGGAKAATAVAADAAATAPAADQGQVVADKPAPICAESPAQLAKDAGLSPAELQVIQSLGARRGELDQREQGLDTQLALIQAAEVKVDAKIATMNALKADMQGLLGQLDDKQQAEVDRLVKVFEGMKPQDAAARFVLLTDEVRLPIASRMKERALSAMLAKMPPPEAKRLTELLAARYVAQANAARQAVSAPTAQAATPPAAPAAQAPAQLAQATTSAAPAATPAKPAVHRKPAPRKAKPATGPAATAQAKPAGGAASGAQASAPPSPSKSAAAPAAPTKAASSPTPAKAAGATPAAPTTPAKSG